MFSGIIEEAAVVAAMERVGDGGRLVVESKLDHARTALGDSIAIDGVCLTVVERSGGRLTFDLAEETLRRSTLGSCKPGSRVNLERSVALGDRIHGHLVYGHVDATIELRSRQTQGNCERLVFSLPHELSAHVVVKGSVSVSGISLTVGEVEGSSFSVYIVPHTSSVTTLSFLRPGDRANFEVDMISRYVIAAIAKSRSAGSGVSEELLAASGYIAEGK